MEQTIFLSDELRSQKSTNWLIGFILALGLLFLGFEFTQREIKLPPVPEDDDDKIYESEMVPVTNEPIVAPPVQPEQVVVVETPEPQIDEVDDEQEIEQEQEIVSTEDNNQAISAVVGTGSPVAAPSGPVGPVGPVVEAGGDDKIYDIVEENAGFPGGEEALMDWLNKNLKYPSKCQEQGVQGQVVVGFVVEKDGRITDIKIVRSPDPDLSKEAERVVKEMPKWKPGKQGNKPVRSRFNLPIRFRLG